MKLLEFHARIKNKYANPRIPRENNENHENHRIPNENHENNENHKISCDNNENHVNFRNTTRIMKKMKIK